MAWNRGICYNLLFQIPFLSLRFVYKFVALEIRLTKISNAQWKITNFWRYNCAVNSELRNIFSKNIMSIKVEISNPWGQSDVEKSIKLILIEYFIFIKCQFLHSMITNNTDLNCAKNIWQLKSKRIYCNNRTNDKSNEDYKKKKSFIC